jgi:hypothetical protein
VFVGSWTISVYKEDVYHGEFYYNLKKAGIPIE